MHNVRIPRAAIAPLLVVCVALPACGQATKTVIVQSPASGQGLPRTDTRPSPSTTPATPAGASKTGSTTATPKAGTAAGEGESPTSVVRLESFQTPTRNIGCVISGETARCDIVRRSWSLPPRPASCPPVVNFGQGVEIEGATAAHLVCAGDTALNPSDARLAYGTASSVGPFQCVSRSTGLTCTNTATRHGFMLSVQQYRIF
jgi:hypothetical protein